MPIDHEPEVGRGSTAQKRPLPKGTDYPANPRPGIPLEGINLKIAKTASSPPVKHISEIGRISQAGGSPHAAPTMHVSTSTTVPLPLHHAAPTVR